MRFEIRWRKIEGKAVNSTYYKGCSFKSSIRSFSVFRSFAVMICGFCEQAKQSGWKQSNIFGRMLNQFIFEKKTRIKNKDLNKKWSQNLKTRTKTVLTSFHYTNEKKEILLHKKSRKMERGWSEKRIHFVRTKNCWNTRRPHRWTGKNCPTARTCRKRFSALPSRKRLEKLEKNIWWPKFWAAAE